MKELLNEISKKYEKCNLLTRNQIQEAMQKEDADLVENPEMHVIVKKILQEERIMKQVEKTLPETDAEAKVREGGTTAVPGTYPEKQEMVVTGQEKREMTLAETMTLGQVMAKSGMFADVKESAQAVVKILAGRELGIGPIVSLTKIYMVQGKVTLSSEVMGGLIKRSGIYDYLVVKHDNTQCQLQFLKNGKPIPDANKGIVTFTIEDARRAGVMKQGSGWEKYPKNMVFARALSNGARWHCPHLIAGAYTPEEMGASVSENGAIVGDYEVVVPQETSREEREKILKEIKGKFETPEKALEVFKKVKKDLSIDSKIKMFSVEEEIWQRFVSTVLRELKSLPLDK